MGSVATISRSTSERREDEGALWRTSEPLEDLEPVACVGLVHAVDRFDPERGTTFSTFAVPTILGELRQHFRDRTWSVRVPRDVRDAATALERMSEALATELGRDRDREVLRLRCEEDLLQREIAARVGVSQMQVLRILRDSVRRLQLVAR